MQAAQSGRRWNVYYWVAVCAGWVLVCAAIASPPADGELTQSLWAKTLLWIPLLVFGSACGIGRLWLLGDAVTWLTWSAAVVVVDLSVAYDYILVGRYLKMRGADIVGGLGVASGVLFLATIVAGLLFPVGLGRVIWLVASKNE